METPGFGAAETVGHLPRRAADVARCQLEPKWEALCAAQVWLSWRPFRAQLITLQAPHAGHGAAGLGPILVWLLICYTHVLPF